MERATWRECLGVRTVSMGLYLGWAEQDSWGRGYRERMGSMSLKGFLDLDAHFLL